MFAGRERPKGQGRWQGGERGRAGQGTGCGMWYKVAVLAGGKHVLSMSSRVTRRRAVFKLRQRCGEGDEGIA